ncbi:MAG: hypothetical protein J0L75_15955 [Spirochaetes bacterium]|nr:hypothetical protein [Spirochaetota bacterium]
MDMRRILAPFFSLAAAIALLASCANPVAPSTVSTNSGFTYTTNYINTVSTNNSAPVWVTVQVETFAEGDGLVPASSNWFNFYPSAQARVYGNHLTGGFNGSDLFRDGLKTTAINGLVWRVVFDFKFNSNGMVQLSYRSNTTVNDGPAFTIDNTKAGMGNNFWNNSGIHAVSNLYAFSTNATYTAQCSWSSGAMTLRVLDSGSALLTSNSFTATTTAALSNLVFTMGAGASNAQPNNAWIDNVTVQTNGVGTVITTNTSMTVTTNSTTTISTN